MIDAQQPREEATPVHSLRIEDVDTAIVSMIPRRLALRYDIVPVRLDEHRHTLIIATPANGLVLSDDAIAEIEQHAKRKLEFQRAPLPDIMALHDELYPPGNPDDEDRAWQAMFAAGISAGLTRGADDVLFDHRGPLGGQVIIHSDGRAFVSENIGLDALRHVQRAALGKAGIPGSDDLTRPHRGRLTVSIDGAQHELRAIYVPTTDESGTLSIRIHPDFHRYSDLQQLLPKRIFSRYWTTINGFNKLVIAAGPPAMGKSTLMRASLYKYYLQTLDPLLRSIEFPLELVLDWLSQIPVGEGTQMTEADAIDYVLGIPTHGLFFAEMRNPYSVAQAIRLAWTAIPVFATTHGDSAPATIWRLLHEEANPYELGQVLACVIGQRLFARLCPNCSVPSKDVHGEHAEAHSLLASRWIAAAIRHGGEIAQLARDHTIRAANPQGCSSCIRGYLGRVPAFDLLVVNDAVRRAIYRKATSDEIAAADPDYEPMWVDAARSVFSGTTSPEEAARSVDLPVAA